MLFNSSNLVINKAIERVPVYEGTEVSLFQESLLYISESDSIIRDMMSGIISKAQLSENSKETFSSEFSFKNIVTKIFDLFKELVSRIVAKFKSLFVRLFGNDKTIEKYKSELQNFNGTLEVSQIDHYNYINLDADIPPLDLKLMFSDEYDSLYGKLKKVQDNKQKPEILRSLNELYNDLLEDNNQNYYNRLRSQILKSTAPITEADFPSKLFSTFRKSNTPTNEDMTADEVRNCANFYFNAPEVLKSVTAQKKDIQSSADKACREITKFSPKDFITDYQPIDYDIEYALDRILQLKTGQLSKACNIIVMGFSSKLDAIKECQKQSRLLLLEAIRYIILQGGKK